jgi:hypothetical protein
VQYTPLPLHRPPKLPEVRPLEQPLPRVHAPQPRPMRQLEPLTRLLYMDTHTDTRRQQEIEMVTP